MKLSLSKKFQSFYKFTQKMSLFGKIFLSQLLNTAKNQKLKKSFSVPFPVNCISIAYHLENSREEK